MLDPALSERIGKPIFDALSQRGFEELTAVQLAVIDAAVEGRDLRISSKTGSGKTVAMGLLVRDELGDAAAGPRVLVITPTRELAKQVEDELGWLFASLGAGVASVTGGSGAAGYKQEMRALAAKPAVVVGTPGRVLDHLERGRLVGENLAAVVLDEADRMLDMGFREDVERIFSMTPATRRTHLVSATFPPDVRALADAIQDDPIRVEGTPLGSANEDIDHLIHLVHSNERLSAIINLLLTTPGEPVLIFAKMRTDVSQLTSDLRDAGFMIGKLSGEMDQHDRNRALQAFKRGQLDALVATDVAARGIDVQGIPRVIHAEPPLDPEAYIHRSGRTGRAGNKGKSSILVLAGELPKTERLLMRAKVRWSFEPVPTADAIREHRDAVFLRTLQEAPEAPRADAVLTLADQVLALPDPRVAVAALLERARALGPTEPRTLTVVSPPERRPREDARGKDRRTFEPRGDQSFEQFRISWGQEHGAETRRLVAMLCRRGDIESRSIGAIRVARTFSTVQIDSAVAAHFAERAGQPDPRDPRITIRRFFAKPAPGDAAAAPGEVDVAAPKPERPTRSFEPRERAERPTRSFEPRERAERPARSFEPRERAERPARSFEPRERAERPARSFEPRERTERPARSFEPRERAERPARSFEPRERPASGDRVQRAFAPRGERGAPREAPRSEEVPPRARPKTPSAERAAREDAPPKRPRPNPWAERKGPPKRKGPSKPHRGR